jgi:phospholipase/carboxylesterase
MSEPLLPCVEIDPPGETRCSVIWLHGLGADGHDFEPLVPYLGMSPELGVRFVFPHAPEIPVTLNMGMVMPAWYDITEMDLRRRNDEDGIRKSAERVSRLIVRENERGVPTSRIVLAGFSQGGAIALHLALRHPEPLAGIMALSTYLVCQDSIEAERSEANAKASIFQAHGDFDPMVQIARGEESRDRLIELGYEVEWHTYPMAHQVHPDEIDDIAKWLTSRLEAALG